MEREPLIKREDGNGQPPISLACTANFLLENLDTVALTFQLTTSEPKINTATV